VSARNFITAAIATAGFQLSVPASRTATVTGSAVDLLNVEGPILVSQDVGAVTGSSPTLAGKIQDSADGSTDWQDISGATFTSVTAANNLQAIKVEANECRRYIRYVGTIGGSTPNFTVGVQAWGRKALV
jgi:hypothetical protein